MNTKLIRSIAIVLGIAAIVTIVTPRFISPGVIAEAVSYKNFGQRYDALPDNITPINSDIASKGDIAAVKHIIDTANRNLNNAKNVAYISTGGGTAKAGLMNMCGELKYSDVYIRDNGAHYSQLVARVTKATAQGNLKPLKLAQALLDQAERKYSPDGKTFYVERVTGTQAEAEMTGIFPYAKADYLKAKKLKINYNELKSKERYLTGIGEYSNLRLNEKTILPSSVSITKNNGLYTVKFKLNLMNKASRDTATELARARLREQSGSKDLEITMYNVTMEIWDNGTIRKFTKEESWHATLNLPMGIKPEGSSYSITSLIYSWNPSDCSIVNNHIDTSWAK